MKPIQECKYSAFISYAHADDVLLGGWIRNFRVELQRGLEARVREPGLRIPEVHLSQDNGPVAGYLGEQLQSRLAESFAMVIVVHETYASSKWCLKELEIFKALYGEQGLRERLFILALSQAAIDQVARSPAWQALMPGGEQVWTEFFPDLLGNSNQPAPIQLDTGMRSQLFGKQFDRLRDAFADRVKASFNPPKMARPWDVPVAAPPAPNGAAAVAAPTSAPTSAPAPAPAATPASAPEPAAPSAIAFGYVPGLEAAAATVAERLRTLKLEVRQFAPTDGPASLEGAGMLVLPFDEQPVSFLVLAQVDQWLRMGRNADRIRWLDLRATPGAQPLPAGAAPAGQRALGADALCDELRPHDEPAALVQRGVTIYIESNQNERNLWKPLGQHLSRKWEEYFRDHSPERRVPLYLKPRGLPVDQIDRYPTLDDADGVVLLWGKKTPEALVAQIDKVERKMSGSSGAPSIVAFLMPPQEAKEPVPAWGWQVLRFDTKDDANIGVLDEVDLRDFLKQVHDRGRLRAAARA